MYGARNFLTVNVVSSIYNFIPFPLDPLAQISAVASGFSHH